METFGERLVYARKLASDALGRTFSQSDLARAVGISQQSIQAIESKTGKPVRGSKHAAKMATVLGVPVLWLTDGVGEMPTVATPGAPPTGQGWLADEMDLLTTLDDHFEELRKAVEEGRYDLAAALGEHIVATIRLEKARSEG